MLKIEEWSSSYNREEIHYFLQDGNNHGYQNAEYLFGINPKYFDIDKINKILGMLKDAKII